MEIFQSVLLNKLDSPNKSIISSITVTKEHAGYELVKALGEF